MKASVLSHSWIAITLLLLAGCNKQSDLPSHANNTTQVRLVNSMDICKYKDKDCVLPSQVFSDIYGSQAGINSIGNYSVIPQQAALSIFSTIKFDDGNDSYGIFLTQANTLTNEGVENCHTCAPLLGIGVYQYHNRWKLFSKDFKVAKIGSWGSILGYAKDPSDVNVVPIGNEKFLITLKTTDGGQGYYSDYLSIIQVNPVGVNQYSSQPIEFLGTIETATSDCGSRISKGEDWISTVSINATEDHPSVTVTKNFRKNCTSEIVPGNQIVLNYKYNGLTKSYELNSK